VRSPVDRGLDRRITVGGGIVAAGFLLAALASLALPEDVRRGIWLPLHLALAGGAALAIAAVLPFFATTLAAAPPASPLLRSAAIALVVAGALGAVVGYPSDALPLAVAGALSFAAGICLVGAAAFTPLSAGRRPIPRLIAAGYAVALVDVVAGVLLVATYLAGWPPLVAAWGAGKAAHAWLNLLGFVSLTIAATLVHLLPTVLGTRIAARPSARLAVVALAVAAPLVAGAMLLGAGPASEPGSAAHGIADLLARAGGVALVVAALGLAVFAGSTWRARGRWTTDAGWHRWIAGALGSAVGWFLATSLLAGGPVVLLGADPAAWSIAAVGPPVAGGWLGLAVLGALGHLLPSIGPGGPVRHARQRAILGRAAGLRLSLLDGAVAVALGGALAGVAPAGPVAVAAYAVGIVWTLALVGRAIAVRDRGPVNH
jgi:nitrite reductase (NO-forming)